jgi:hypothetical protein
LPDPTSSSATASTRARRTVDRAAPPFLPETAEPRPADFLDPEPRTESFKAFYSIGKAVFDGSGEAIAAARSPDEGRRIAAALNTAYGIPTDALEAWSVGSVQDPVNDVLAEIESVVAPPASQDRRGTDRRGTDRRRGIHEVRIEQE